jgi:metal-responsive CopG/Arc/MetJ family transcriptional regulator
MEVCSMRATVTIDKKILDELVQESGHKNKATAVREAVGLYLKQKKVDKIKLMKGKLKFDKTAEELRHYER